MMELPQDYSRSDDEDIDMDDAMYDSEDDEMDDSDSLDDDFDLEEDALLLMAHSTRHDSIMPKARLNSNDVDVGPEFRDYTQGPYAEPIMHHFGIDTLRQHGYIDFRPSPTPVVDVDFAPDATKLPDYITWTPVHPIFARKNWTISDTNWAYMAPVIRMASCFLCEPAILPFLDGLVDGPRVPIDPASKVAQRMKRPLFCFMKSRMIGDPDLKATWLDIAQIAYCVHWTFGKVEGETDAETTEDDKRPGLQNDKGPTYGSNVKLNEKFIVALASQGKEATAYYGAESHDPHSALLRVQFFLATTMIHELCHVIGNATGAWEDLELPPVEDFYRDQRIAEYGDALESVFFNGRTQTISGIHSAPFGLLTSSWPGGVGPDEYDPDDLPIHASAAARGLKYHNQYLVSMKYVHRFFTKAFWHKEAAIKPGLGAFHPPREYGIRYTVSSRLHADEMQSDIDQHLESPLEGQDRI